MTIDTRRGLIIGGAAAMASGAATGAFGQAKRLDTTPTMDLGPYYPVIKPVDKDSDLTRVAGRKGRAKGQVMMLSGRVLNRDGAPIANAALEIWQCDANGRYAHPSEDTRDAKG